MTNLKQGSSDIPGVVLALGITLACLPLLGCSENPPSLVEGQNQIPKVVAQGSRGSAAMVVGTTGGQAQDIGAQILKMGGNAVDAAIATAMGQIVLAGGSWVSFAGIADLMIYDRKT